MPKPIQKFCLVVLALIAFISLLEKQREKVANLKIYHSLTMVGGGVGLTGVLFPKN